MDIRRLGRRTGLVMAVVAGFATAAAADPPARNQFTNFGTFVLTDVCSFPITLQGTADITGTTFFDESGAVRRYKLHWVEQDTFSANGNELVGIPYTSNMIIVLDSEGNPTRYESVGVTSKVPLPDGSLFIGAGQVDWLIHGDSEPIITPDNGATVNLDKFCAALAK